MNQEFRDRFAALHVPGDPLLLYNIWDVGSALAVAKGGAPALSTGSHSLAEAQGYSDGEGIPLKVLLETVRRIVAPRRACLGGAVREGLIASNPCASLALPHRPRIDDDDEAEEHRDRVWEEVSGIGSEVNNCGLAAQLAFLLADDSADHIATLLHDLTGRAPTRLP